MKTNSFVFLPKIKWSVIYFVFLLISFGVAEFENNTSVINKSGHFTVFAIKSKNYNPSKNPIDLGTNKYSNTFLCFPSCYDSSSFYNPHNFDTTEEIYLINYDKNIKFYNKDNFKEYIRTLPYKHFTWSGDTLNETTESDPLRIKEFSVDEALKKNPYKKFVIHKNQLHLDPNFEYNIEINEQFNLEFKKAGPRREDTKIFTPFHIVYILLKEIFSSES
jgi:hypothetical protein